MAGVTPPGRYVGTELPVFSLANNWKRYVSRILTPYIKRDVLEVGAGIGAAAVALMNRSVTRWVALEPDAILAASAAAVTIDPTGKIAPEVLVGTIEDLAPEDRFHTILYVDVLEHIADDLGELERATSRLRPGGHLIVLAPAFPAVYSEFDRAIGHYRRYTAKSLSAAMPRVLERSLLVYADSLGLVLSLMNRVLLRQSTPQPKQVLFWDRVVIPISRVADLAFRRWFGRSVIAVYERPLERADQRADDS